VGTYYWIASYSGDTSNQAVTTACGDSYESSVVGQASPKIVTVASASPSTGTIGVTMTVGDTATVSGGYNLNGKSVSFALYSDSGCSNAVSGVSGSGTISGGSASYSTSWTPSTNGTYYWKASYAGDTNNKGYTACGGNNETVIVGQASPTITTKLSKSHGYVGDSIYDSALLTGATATATGSVTYSVYSDKTCSTKYADAGTVTVASGAVPNSKAIPFFGTATYYWQAAYSGDAKNSPAISTCTEETLVVDPTPTPTPFQKFEGATGTPVRVATPPVTSTDGSSHSGDSMPLFALLICLSFGGLGLLAVQAQRQSIRK
jgi:hypothetical protein